jgi:hypothetical protein
VTGPRGPFFRRDHYTLAALPLVAARTITKNITQVSQIDFGKIEVAFLLSTRPDEEWEKSLNKR